MTTPLWQTGTTYLPGDLVTPNASTAAVPTDILNPGFEDGDTAWTKGTGWSIQSGYQLTGNWAAKHTGSGTSDILQFVASPVAPGTTITARAFFAQGTGSKDKVTGRIILQWLDATDAVVSTSLGTNIVSSSGSAWKVTTVSATAPAAATKVKIGGRVVKTQSDACWFDQFSWDYYTPTVPDGLVYKAVQALPGLSGSEEPAWPTTLGVQVVDNEVTWEATQASRIVWTASPALRSDALEPVWPTAPGEVVADGTIAWECISRVVEDENCPQSKVVQIAASKIFAADDDIIRYSATVNPLDWTTENDAGYLPTGLQQYGSNPVAAIGLYRSNLVAFNSQAFQMWQVDEDPANMALLDALPIGSRHHWALSPVSNDLFFMSSLGVRTIGIAGASTNLQGGDVGMPVDSLVQASILAAAAAGAKPLATYYPSAGQYWLTTTQDRLIINGDVPDGYVGDVYDEPFECHNGVPPYTYALLSGATMTGTAFDPNDTPLPTVGGTATTPGVFTFTVRGTDSAGNTADSPQVVTILGPEPTYLLSHPYPIAGTDSLVLTATLAGMQTFTAFNDFLQGTAALTSAQLSTVVVKYEDWPVTVADESLQGTAELTEVLLTTVVVKYEDWPVTVADESLQGTAVLTGVTLNTVVVSADSEVDGVQGTAVLTGVILT